ncbi:MAG: acyltransferase [Nitriliruptorales bacterium]|nr:acyltransferase [Nitriliruptorales bacterium]
MSPRDDRPDRVAEAIRGPVRAEVAADAAVEERVAFDDVDELQERLRVGVERAIEIETAREATRRASQLQADLEVEAGVPPTERRPPMRLRYPRFGWRRSIRMAVQRRMYTPQYLGLYARYLRRRAALAVSRHHVELHGLVFTGKRVEFYARPGHGRVVVGPWCWIGNDNKLRAHEGQLTLGAKVVMGRDNVVNTYLDIEIGDASILADWIYICDFDHRYERLDVPIKDQGIVKSPVRIGGDVWMGEKASVLRGVDIGHGSVIASHCVVNRDVPPFSIAVGVPVRVIKSRLPKGLDPEEALDLVRRGEPIPGDPLEG